MIPRDIEVVMVRPDPFEAECVHGWSLLGIPSCERCWRDRKARERFSEAMRHGRQPHVYADRLVPQPLHEVVR